MRRIGVFILISSLISIVLIVCLENSSFTEEEVPDGMEIKMVGDLKILVPKGAKVEKTGKGGLISIESTSEFTSRKVENLENRMALIEESQKVLEAKLSELEMNMLAIESKIRNSALVSE